MKDFTSNSSQKGQVLLLVVLASVIALTVGLAAVSRSITSTRISTEESNSQKALSAAEAGIEEQITRALSGAISDDPYPKDLNNNSNFISDAKEDIPEAGILFNVSNGDTIQQDEGVDIWLSDYPNFEDPISSSFILNIFWDRIPDDDCPTPNEAALEIVVIYGPNKNNPSMNRYAVDRCAAARGNNFDPPSGGTANRNRFTFTVPASSYIARVIPLYNNTTIQINSAVALPKQGYIIESTGKSGDSVRKLQVYQGFPRLPIEFFPYNLFLP